MALTMKEARDISARLGCGFWMINDAMPYRCHRIPVGCYAVRVNDDECGPVERDRLLRQAARVIAVDGWCATYQRQADDLIDALVVHGRWPA